ncbi:oligomeric golgi complex subunit 5 [Echinococcus multilocularis]|uniref:Oligomeric golgi complex subunit 5 n=1 Tax=Echinococcus multilocularis TaxID=6211 RepID=A0A087W0X1_ECHMU|nr:oligomeric golgi complex subunit 5 [Echinococcus multilocularis]
MRCCMGYFRLDASISQHVSKHNNELLNQTVELENFSNIVGSVESRIMSVSGSVNMIKQRIAKHYDHLSTQVTLIRRLGIVYEALRGILRISSTLRKLHASSDIVQASECVEELDYTFNLVEWKGITVLEEQHKDVVKEKERVTGEAWELIHTSFKSRDRAGLGLALQAFNNLSVLPKVIQALVSDWQTEIERAVKSSADVDDLSKRAKGKVISSLTSTTPGKASLPSGGGHSAAFRNLLWAGLDQMVGTLDQCLAQVRMLCVTLKKKRPSAGNVLTSTTLFSGLCSYLLKNLDNPDERDRCIAIMMVLYNEETNCASDFVLSKIRQLAKKVDSYLAEVCSDGLLGWIVTCLNTIFEPALRRRSGQLKEALERDYPRLLKLFLNISDQQQLLSDPIKNFLASFETAYLGRCLTRLCDRVNSTFADVTTSESNGENLPRLIDAERMVQTVATELAHSAAVQRELFCKITRNVAKMVALLSTKVEALIITSPEAFQVSADGLPTTAQQKNAHLVTFTCTFVDRLRITVAGHSTVQQQMWECRKLGVEDPREIIDKAIVTELSSVCLSALEPILKAIKDYILDYILPRMHKEIPDGDEDPPYVHDLQAFINRMRTEYLTGFSVSLSTTGSGIRSADKQIFTSGEAAVNTGLQTRVLPHCLDALAVHTSLFRPCTDEAQRSRLTTGSAAIEMALATLAPPSVSTEGAFARLRTLRQLFSLPTEDILSMSKSQGLALLTESSRRAVGLGDDCLPGSLVLHHVIARSPEEIPLPHQTASGWSLDRYIRWCLSTADEATRLAFITKALDVYTEQVQERKQRTYPPIYLVIRDLLEYYLHQQQ